MLIATADQISQRLSQLLTERGIHADAIERINATLGGIASLIGGSNRSTAKLAPTAVAQPVEKKRRGPGSYPATAVEVVLAFLKDYPHATTAQVNAHWSRAGRNGKADNTLTALVKAGRLKRDNIKGKRGSKYSVK